MEAPPQGGALEVTIAAILFEASAEAFRLSRHLPPNTHSNYGPNKAPYLNAPAVM